MYSQPHEPGQEASCHADGSNQNVKLVCYITSGRQYVNNGLYPPKMTLFQSIIAVEWYCLPFQCYQALSLKIVEVPISVPTMETSWYD